MSGTVNWKAKYTELKSKFMESVDMAFRIGFEQGAQQAQQDNAMQQQQQEHELNQAALGGMDQPGAPGGPSEDIGEKGPNGEGFADQEPPGPSQPGEPGKGVPMKESEHPEGSELDRHISMLESMLKSETPINPADLILLTGKIQGLRKSMKEAVELRKSAAAIPKIAQALHKPQFKIGVQANQNMTQAAKNAVTMQHKIVDNIMQKWEQEERKAGQDILSQLNIEGLTKNEK